MPVILLTGFLGSGKTTILRNLLGQPAMAGTAVIINEFGEVGIDHLLVGSPVLEPMLLANGCICCAARGQLSTTLQELTANSVFKDVRRVIVETTGLANPVPLLQALTAEQTLAERFRFGGVVTTADCVNGTATLAAYDEAACQVAVADLVLVTKTDLASTRAIAELKRNLCTINPAAPMLDIVSGVLDADVLSQLTLHDAMRKGGAIRRWLGAHAGTPHLTHIHAHRISTFSILRDCSVPWAAFVRWLETIAAARGDDLLRVKGIVNVAEWPNEPVVIHGVQHIFHPPVRLPNWPDEDRRTRIVFITRGLARETIEASLHLLDSESAAAVRFKSQGIAPPSACA